MSYNYEEEKQRIFTELGQIEFLKIRDKAFKLCLKSGAVRMDKLLIGDSWFSMACVDRMVELGELREVTQPGKECGQDRVFVAIIAEA